MTMRQFFIFIFLILSVSSFAQTNVSGRVVDPSIGEALIGAAVVLEGTIIGTTTDLDGKFSFSVNWISK